MKSASLTFVLSVVHSLSTFFAATGPCFAQERVDPAGGLIEVQHNVRVDNDRRYLCEGDVLNLQVRAIGGVAVYVYVIYQDAHGDSLLLFPNAAESNNRLVAGQLRTVPGRDNRTRFAIAGPFGHERLQVFASPQPLPQIEQQFHAGQSVEDLDELLKWAANQPSVETQVSEFETRAHHSTRVPATPELVR